MYIDDICIALKDEKEAIEVRKFISGMFEEIVMKVIKYMSNSSKVLNSIPKDDLGPLMENDEPDEKEIKSANTKILGISYDPVQDLFHFSSYAKLLEKELIFTTHAGFLFSPGKGNKLEVSISLKIGRSYLV